MSRPRRRRYALTQEWDRDPRWAAALAGAGVGLGLGCCGGWALARLLFGG